MPFVQVIQHAGRPVAVVIGTDQAVISRAIPSQQRQCVGRMCVFAFEIAAGERPGPYRDEDAERYAVSG